MLAQMISCLHNRDQLGPEREIGTLSAPGFSRLIPLLSFMRRLN